MPKNDVLSKFDGMTANEIISHLEEQYKDDPDALEDIERAKKNIAYIKSQKDYDGQTPKQCALSLAGELMYWN